MRRINEIFYSLQGEGYYTGTPAVFIRFSGCNLNCEFCDTDHREGVLMTDEMIVAEVLRYPARMVVLTGGEPALSVDEGLVERLHSHGKYVCIETNGTLPLPDCIDWVTCSPKQSPEEVALTRIDELKLVYRGQDVTPFERVPATHYFLQPCSGQNTHETIDCILRHPKWRLSLQTHKLLNIR